MSQVYTSNQVKRLLVTTVVITSTLVWVITYFVTKNSAQEQYFAKQMEMLKASEEQYQKMHSPLNAIIGNETKRIFK
jgi:hypothetical protein